MSPRMLLAFYSVVFFLSAALLFSVQPMIAKMVLPKFGGSPAVWSTCMVFFQATLLAGYGYAHLISRWLRFRAQLVLHCVLILCALPWLPFTIPDHWTGQSLSPTISLLSMLVLVVGVPMFVVTTTAPLMQRWFSNTAHGAADDPYFLYSISNVGSMVALLAYPFAVEPQLTVSWQSGVWAIGYVCLVCLLIGCAVITWRTSAVEASISGGLPSGASPAEGQGNPNRRRSGQTRRSTQPATASRHGHPSGEAIVVDGKERLRWLLLSFVPSSWMLAVTTQITTDITPFPLLWIVPLALYLLTFILVFARRQLIAHEWIVRLFPGMVVLLIGSQIVTGRWQLIVLQLAAFFVGAMACHGALAKRRPRVRHLTEYYFLMSLGGVLGGVFNALLAPLLFPAFFELAITVGIACLLVAVERLERKRNAELILLGAAALAVAWLIRSFDSSASVMFVMVAVVALPVLLLLSYLGRLGWFAGLVSVVLLWDQLDASDRFRVLHRARSFFGIHQVVEDRERIDPETRAPHPRFRRLMHGVTEHGIQSIVSDRQCTPLSYYHNSGPLGDLFATYSPQPGRMQQVAVIGLGTGAMACYAGEQRFITFYEVDPVVKRVAEDRDLFTYLSNCGGEHYSIVVGDGRLQVAEAAREAYQLIVLDAFSSDAIPTHLLTTEAIDLYFERLSVGGVVVFHISNRYLDLSRVLAANASQAGYLALVCRDARRSDEDLGHGIYPSTYVVMGRAAEDLRTLQQLPRWEPLEAEQGRRAWTDDYSDILTALRWNPLDVARGE